MENVRFSKSIIGKFIIVLAISNALLFVGALVFGGRIVGSIRKFSENEIRTVFEKETKKSLKDIVESASSILEYYYGKAQAGTITEDEAKTKAIAEIGSIRYSGDRGYLWVNDMSEPFPKMIMHPIVPSLNGKILDSPKFNCAMGKNENLFSAMVRMCKKSGSGFVDYEWPDPKDRSKVLPKLSYVKLFKPWNMVVGTGRYIDEIDKNIGVFEKSIAKKTRGSMTFFFVSIALIMCIVLVVVLIFARRNSENFKKIISELENISSGESDLRRRIAVSTNDELGVIAFLINKFIEQLQEHTKDIVTVTKDVDAKFNDIVSDVNENLGTGITSAKNLQDISAATEQSSSNATNIAAAAEELSANSSSVAAAIEEMSATVNEISSSVQKEAQLAGEAYEQSNGAKTLITNLSNAATEIGKVVEMISNIADQTNLLALNATIEAASAGDAGKGFAVVANEVKELAKQATEATGQIREQITSVQMSVSDSVSAIDMISSKIDEVNSSSQTIMAAVEEESATINEISSNMSGANAATKEIAQNAQEFASGLNEINVNISETNEIFQKTRQRDEKSAEKLKETREEINKLRQDADRFIV